MKEVFLLKKLIFLLVFVNFLLVGCTSHKSSKDVIEAEKEYYSYPINYRTDIPQEYVDDLDVRFDYSNYEQSRQKMYEFQQQTPMNQSGDLYTTEQTDQITIY